MRSAAIKCSVSESLRNRSRCGDSELSAGEKIGDATQEAQKQQPKSTKLDECPLVCVFASACCLLCFVPNFFVPLVLALERRFFPITVETFRLWPIETQCDDEGSMRCRKRIGFVIGTRRLMLDIKHQSPVGITFQSR
jgi:hypothetical protein